MQWNIISSAQSTAEESFYSRTEWLLNCRQRKTWEKSVYNKNSVWTSREKSDVLISFDIVSSPYAMKNFLIYRIVVGCPKWGLHLHQATQMISVLHCPPFIVICSPQFLTLTLQKNFCWNEPHCKCPMPLQEDLEICKCLHTWQQPWHPLLCSMIFPLHIVAEMNYGNLTLYFCCSYAA